MWQLGALRKVKNHKTKRIDFYNSGNDNGNGNAIKYTKAISVRKGS